MAEQLNIAVFASGRGSNLEAILDAVEAGQIPNAKIVLVISNNSDAGALALARNHNVPAVHLSRKQFTDDEALNRTLMAMLENHQVNFIALAGYMKKIDRSIVMRFKNRIVNIHPALLPKFGGGGMYGHRVHEAVLASHEKLSGATVHIVDEEYDHGPIILQRTVPIAENETPETLAAKVLKIEHRIYPEAIRLFAEERVKIDKQHISILQ